MQKYKYLRRKEAFFIKISQATLFLTENGKDTQQETDHDESNNFFNFPIFETSVST